MASESHESIRLSWRMVINYRKKHMETSIGGRECFPNWSWARIGVKLQSQLWGEGEHTSVTKFAANEAEINCEIIYLSVNGVGCACCISRRLSLLVCAIIKSLFLLELINVNWRFRINSDSGPRTSPSLLQRVWGAPTSDLMHVFD